MTAGTVDITVENEDITIRHQILLQLSQLLSCANLFHCA